jgi:hypothetical protein
MRKIIISKETCAEFNKFRAEHTNELYTAVQMTNLLRKFGFKCKNYVTQGVRLGILIRVSHGKYAFCKEPVHITKLQTWKENSIPHKGRKRVSVLPQNSEEIAIDLLKSLGYRIQKPQIDIEAAMENPEQPVKNFIKFIEIR